MLGKAITLHRDGVAQAVLLYRPEVTDELTLSVSWLRDHVTIDLTMDEMEALGKRLTKGVKKVRKHQKKHAKDKFVALEDVVARIHNGKRK